jgi:membrane-associated protease RseP (regulator of RpoE activity)
LQIDLAIRSSDAEAHAMGLILFLSVLFLIILWHELGHLIAAKLLGVGVQELSVFLGPRLFWFRLGTTRYTVRLLPLGGYVDPVDWSDVEDMEELPEVEKAMVKDHRRWLAGQPLWERVAMFAAGPGINLLTAAVILLLVGMPAQWSGNLWTVMSAAWNAEAREAVLGYAQRSGEVHWLDCFSGLRVGWNLGAASFLRHIAVLNLFLGLLNLLPLLPLDGGKIVFELMTFRLHRGQTKDEIIAARRRTHNVLGWLSLLGLILFIVGQCCL